MAENLKDKDVLYFSIESFHISVRSIFFLLLFSLLSGELLAQETSKKKVLDSTYVRDQSDKFNIRIYMSRKYTDFVVRNGPRDNVYRFQPNSGINLGFGFTYQGFTLNLAAPVGFLNPGRDPDFGGFLDLQTHLYTQNWIVDFFGQFYEGYTIDASELENSDEDFRREDVQQVLIGANVNYLLSGQKVSLKAAYHQAAIQRKSAFSPFVGAEAYGGYIQADSLLFPDIENADEINFRRLNYILFGPNIGFASSLVIVKRFYLTAVASANLSFGYTNWERAEEFREWGVVPTYFLRGFAGYNWERFSVNGSYTWKNLNLVPNGQFNQAVNTGNFRINIVYKLPTTPKFKKTFNKYNPALIPKKVFGSSN